MFKRQYITRLINDFVNHFYYYYSIDSVAIYTSPTARPNVYIGIILENNEHHNNRNDNLQSSGYTQLPSFFYTHCSLNILLQIKAPNPSYAMMNKYSHSRQQASL